MVPISSSRGSARLIGLLGKPFEGGGGPSHATISLIWEMAGASKYLPGPEEGNKLSRVRHGLRNRRESAVVVRTKGCPRARISSKWRISETDWSAKESS